MAAPHVTGLAALLLEVRPSLTSQQAQQLLQRSARRNGVAAAAPDDSWGAGRIDAAAAVELARKARFPIIHGIEIEVPASRGPPISRPRARYASTPTAAICNSVGL